MIIKLCGNTLVITREPTDRKYYGTSFGSGESNFLYALKNELNRRGFNLIKKRMYKDGHLVDDLQQYLRTKDKHSHGPHVYIYSNFWALRGLNDDWNEGEVSVSIDFDVFDKYPASLEQTKQLLNQ